MKLFSNQAIIASLSPPVILSPDAVGAKNLAYLRINSTWQYLRLLRRPSAERLLAMTKRAPWN